MYARIPLPPPQHDWLIRLRVALEEANNAHDACNDLTVVSERLAIDRALQVKINQLEIDLSSEDYANNQAIQNALRQVRDLLALRLTQTSHSLQLPVSLQLPNEPETPLSKAIAQLPDVAAEKVMLAIFIDDPVARNAALKNIFAPDDVSKVAQDWKDYTDTHTFGQRLGSNSNSIMVSSAIDASEILKAEYRLGNSRHMDSVVRASLPDLFTSHASARMLIGPGIPHKGLSSTGRTLMVTNVCHFGGAQDYAQTLRNQDALRPPEDTTFLTETLNIARQMCKAFEDLEDNNLYFPDAKISNWLVDSAPGANPSPILRIADTKAFLRCAPHTQPDLQGEPDNRNARLIATNGYYSTEVFQNLTPTHSIHSGIFGKNLYAFLTGKAPTPDNIKACVEPVFRKPFGIVYTALIRALTTDSPHERMTVHQAGALLRQLEILPNPLYKSVEDKMTELELILPKYVLRCLLGSLTDLLSKPGCNLNNALIAIDNSLQEILVVLEQCLTRYDPLTTPPTLYDGEDLITETIFLADLRQCIHTTQNLDMLLSRLRAHNSHLEDLENSSFRQVETLRNRCLGLGFGSRDTVMANYLEKTKRKMLRSTDLVSRCDDINKMFTRLTALIDTLEDDPMLSGLKLLLQERNNTPPGIEAEALDAILDAAIQVPVPMRSQLFNFAEPTIAALNDATAMLSMTRDPAFLAITDKLNQLNRLTQPEDNSKRLFESLKIACRQFDDTERVFDALHEVLDKALLVFTHIEPLLERISFLPTAYLGVNKPMFPGSLIRSDLFECIKQKNNIDELSVALEEHREHLTNLIVVEESRLPETFKTLIEYMSSVSVSAKDHNMKRITKNFVTYIFEQDNLNERIDALNNYTPQLVRISDEFKKPENVELRRMIAEKMSEPGDEASRIEALAIAVPIDKRTMAHKNAPAMRNLLAALQGDDLEQQVSIRI